MEDSTTEAVRISVDKKIDSFGEGDLEYATETLSALWEIVNKDGDIEFPLDEDFGSEVSFDWAIDAPPTVGRFWFGFFPAFSGVLTLPN